MNKTIHTFDETQMQLPQYSIRDNSFQMLKPVTQKEAPQIPVRKLHISRVTQGKTLTDASLEVPAMFSLS
jgi:hypothetical protein